MFTSDSKLDCQLDIAEVPLLQVWYARDAPLIVEGVYFGVIYAKVHVIIGILRVISIKLF